MFCSVYFRNVFFFFFLIWYIFSESGELSYPEASGRYTNSLSPTVTKGTELILVGDMIFLSANIKKHPLLHGKCVIQVSRMYVHVSVYYINMYLYT